MPTYQAALADLDRNLRAASLRLDRAEESGDLGLVATCQTTVDALLDRRVELARAERAE